MANLKKYTLSKDDKKGDWKLTNDQSGRTVSRFGTKAEATKGGVLQDAVGTAGGSVKIRKEDGKYQEERTFPKSKDPRESKG